MFTNFLTYIFPGGRTLELIKNGVNVTNSSNPVKVITNVTLTVIDCCAPPPIRLAANCIAAGAVIATSVVSPNPITIGSAIHLITEIYDKC